MSTPLANPRYGRPAPRPASPTPVGDSTLFCETCLKNQALLTQTLSNYLPSLDDPRYDQYEASYPEFKRRLEERLPQVCAECEPRVQQRIQQAGYAAKADHLRRVMERAKHSRASAESWVWRWRAAALGWLLQSAAFCGHLAFHGLGVLAVEEPGLRDDTAPPSLRTCFEMGFHHRNVPPGCVDSARPLLSWATMLALLTIWWNPIMGRKAMVRVRGLEEFYKLQCILLLARLVSWYLFREDSEHDFDVKTAKAIHGVMLAFNVAVHELLLRLTMAKSDIRTGLFDITLDCPCRLGTRSILLRQVWNPIFSSAVTRSRTTEEPARGRENLYNVFSSLSSRLAVSQKSPDSLVPASDPTFGR